MTDIMDPPSKNSSMLFDVFLRLRPPTAHATDRFLTVEKGANSIATQITINPPPDDYRRRAIERYSFTKIFEEDANQLDIFEGTNVLPLIRGVLGSQEREGRDGLLATLGVTGSGKSHTILGSKSQRGLTQMSLDVLFRSIGGNIVQPQSLLPQLAASDATEAQLSTAAQFVEFVYGEGDSRMSSRAHTPLPVSFTCPSPAQATTLWGSYESMLGRCPDASLSPGKEEAHVKTIRMVTGFARITRSVAKARNPHVKEQASTIIYPSLPKANAASKRYPPRPSALPQSPDVQHLLVDSDQSSEYAVILSMYEVYNNRICDLLTSITSSSKSSIKDTWKPALLFKSTEFSPDKKVVAGLRKIVCGSLEEALMVLETGLSERAVAGTGSNATSSRSHGFFCVEVKRRMKSCLTGWSGSTLTIADLAGSERARAANTFGSTLAEAGKINQSLMLLGQCMQAQSGISRATDFSLSKLAIRQCKLTELLFSNSFHHPPSSLTQQPRAQQQKAIMIVTADPRGDYNATSQILKYSALAKETTVPRIPSVTSTIYPGNPFNLSSRPIPTIEPAEDDTRLAANLDALQAQLEEQRRLRLQTEASWAHAEARLETIEAEVREECWNSFESQMLAERGQWQAAWEVERERNEGHVDSKLEVLMRGIQIDEGDDTTDNPSTRTITAVVDDEPTKREMETRLAELERENEALRDKVRMFERERAGRTPSRKVRVLKARPWNVGDGDGGWDENLSR